MFVSLGANEPISKKCLKPTQKKCHDFLSAFKNQTVCLLFYDFVLAETVQ